MTLDNTTLRRRLAAMRAMVRELSDELECEIEARRSGEIPRKIERDLELVREARKLLEKDQ